jgi:hypothetical protein
VSSTPNWSRNGKASIALQLDTDRPLCLKHAIAAWIDSGQPSAMIRHDRRAPPHIACSVYRTGS